MIEPHVASTHGVHTGRFRAEFPDSTVVFMIGMRFNSLRRVNDWLPTFRAMPKMLAELSNQPELGLLAYRSWIHWRQVMVVQYWRDMDHLMTYATARDSEHLLAWNVFNRRARQSSSVGIWHEAYEVHPQTSHIVYRDMPPTGMGAAVHLTIAEHMAPRSVARRGTSPGIVRLHLPSKGNRRERTVPSDDRATDRTVDFGSNRRYCLGPAGRARVFFSHAGSIQASEDDAHVAGSTFARCVPDGKRVDRQGWPALVGDRRLVCTGRPSDTGVARHPDVAAYVVTAQIWTGHGAWAGEDGDEPACAFPRRTVLVSRRTGGNARRARKRCWVAAHATRASGYRRGPPTGIPGNG